jgi:hypothetical protein
MMNTLIRLFLVLTATLGGILTAWRRRTGRRAPYL